MLVDQHTRALLTAIVQEPAAHNQQDLADLVREIVDWDALLDVARAHRLLPLLISRVNGMEAAIPPETQRRLRAEYDSNAFHTLANAADLWHCCRHSISRTFLRCHSRGLFWRPLSIETPHFDLPAT